MADFSFQKSHMEKKKTQLLGCHTAAKQKLWRGLC